MPRIAPLRRSVRPVVLEFFRLFAPLLLVLVAGGWLYGDFLLSTHRAEMRREAEASVQHRHQTLSLLIDRHVQTCAFLAEAVDDIMAAAGANKLREANADDLITREFVALVRHSPYAQARILDARGHEVVRVDKRGEVVSITPPEQLQDKSSRYYVQDLMRAGSGVYISRLDLNVEHGQLELPYNPVLRFGAPVHFHGASSAPDGYVVLNLSARKLLQFALLPASPTLHPYLLTVGGDVLAAPDGFDEHSELAWGFVVNPAARPLGGRMPAAWERIAELVSLTANGEVRRFITSDGLFTFSPLDPAASDHNKAITAAQRWLVLSHTPQQALWPPQTDWYIAIWAGLVLCAALGCAISAQARASRRATLRELTRSEQRFRALTTNATDAIIVIDSLGTIQFWNPAAERLFGYSEDEALQSPLHALVASPDDREKAENGLQTFRHSGEGEIIGTAREVTAYRKDGHSFPAELSVSAFNAFADEAPSTASSPSHPSQGNAHGGFSHGAAPTNGWWAVGIVRDVTRRKENERRLEYLATTDELTGLPNRRQFMETARAEYLRARRYGHGLAFMMVDIDHFKRVNDTHGHDVGDEVLRAMARIGADTVRETDVLGRLGGEEFGWLLPETDVDNARSAARRLLDAIRHSDITTSGGTLRITVSIGLTMLRSDEAPSKDAAGRTAPQPDRREVDHRLDIIMKRADVALYRAKQNGRDRFEEELD